MIEEGAEETTDADQCWKNAGEIKDKTKGKRADGTRDAWGEGTGHARTSEG